MSFRAKAGRRVNRYLILIPAQIGPRPHLTWACTIGRRDDPFPFHLLNHSGRAVVPNSEPSLNHRDRCLPAVEHDPQRLVVELVALFSAMRAVVTR